MKTNRFKKDVLGLVMAAVLLLVGIFLIITGLFVNKNAIFTNKGKLEIDYSQINYGDIRPPTAIVFEYDGKEIGRLEWGSGEFQFIGKADQSAKVFFKYFLKPRI